jgi:hypothetical protein
MGFDDTAQIVRGGVTTQSRKNKIKIVTNRNTSKSQKILML